MTGRTLNVAEWLTTVTVPPAPNPRDTGVIAAEPSRPWTHQRLSELEREVARLRERVEVLEGTRR